MSVLICPRPPPSSACSEPSTVGERQNVRGEVAPVIPGAEQAHRLWHVGAEHVRDRANDRVLAQRPAAERHGHVALLDADGHDRRPRTSRREHARESGCRAADLEEHVWVHTELRECVDERGATAEQGLGGAEPAGEVEPRLVEVNRKHARAGGGGGKGQEGADASGADDDRVIAGLQPTAAHGVHSDGHRLGKPERVE